MITLEEAAKRLGIDVAEILGFFGAGLIDAEEKDGVWYITVSDFEKLKDA